MIKLAYYCPFAQQNGYSRAAADYLMALHLYRKAHPGELDLAIVPMFACALSNIEDGYEELAGYVSVDFEPTHAIFHGMPNDAIRAMDSWIEHEKRLGLDGAKRLCMTTWETSALPEDISCNLRLFDRIFVPSRSVEAVFRDNRSGVAVEIIEHCFDPDFWEPDSDAWGDRDQPFVFYTVGADTQRKNLGGLLRAYLTAFTADDPVILRIHAPGADILGKVDRFEEMSGLRGIHNLPVIEMTDGSRLDSENLRSFHQAGDCFVSLSRGEGWGLGAFEAATVGNDVIVSRYGGPMHFLPEIMPEHFPNLIEPVPGFARVQGALTPVFAEPEIVMSQLSIGAQAIPMPRLRMTMPEGANALQSWFEPDIVAARTLMVQLAQARRSAFDPERRFDAAAAIHALASEFYSYKVIGQKLMRAIEAV